MSINRGTRTGALLLSAGLGLAPAAAGPIVSLYSRHPEPNGQFGISVTTLQTIDPTVYRVAVGAPREQVGTYDLAGRVVIFDHAGAVVRTLVSPNKQTAGFFGYCVASVPDVTGDAISDLAVGAPNEGNEFSGRGRVYIFNSITGALVRTLSSPVNEVGGWFGKSVCGIGDVTGDSRGDVIVGAMAENTSIQVSGRAYLVRN